MLELSSVKCKAAIVNSMPGLYHLGSPLMVLAPLQNAKDAPIIVKFVFVDLSQHFKRACTIAFGGPASFTTQRIPLPSQKKSSRANYLGPVYFNIPDQSRN